jgi:alcohol dehydrogenase/propanol-preferring alcohol dehydrogenase
MKAIQVGKAGGSLDLVERSIPDPKPDWVRIKVQACGICHSDMLLKEGYWPACSIRACQGTRLRE